MRSATVNTAASGDTYVVAAPGQNRKIRVHGYNLVAAGAVTSKFKDAGADATGAMSMITGVPVYAGYNPEGWFDMTLDRGLGINLGGAVQVSGHVTYSVLNEGLDVSTNKPMMDFRFTDNSQYV